MNNIRSIRLSRKGLHHELPENAQKTRVYHVILKYGLHERMMESSIMSVFPDRPVLGFFFGHLFLPSLRSILLFALGGCHPHMSGKIDPDFFKLLRWFLKDTAIVLSLSLSFMKVGWLSSESVRSVFILSSSQESGSFSSFVPVKMDRLGSTLKSHSSW